MSYCVFCVCLCIVMSNILFFQMSLLSEFCAVIVFYNFRIKTTLGSFLPPVVCRRDHVLVPFYPQLFVEGIMSWFLFTPSCL